MSTASNDVLIGVEELQRLVAPVVVDVRWSLGGPPGHEAYLAGHVPGAVYADLDTELAGVGEASEGRHPLPTIDDLQAAARRWGIGTGATVVVYDGGGNLAAARAWWLLRWAGIADVRLLDGAWPAWLAAGGEVATDDVRPTPGDVVLTPGHLPTAEPDEIAAWGGVLIDARAPERFRGESEPVDPKAGHVPGARNLPTPGNLDPDGRFLAPEQLRARFAGVGAGEPGTGPVAAYCGSGIHAAHTVAALALAGIDATLFPGSWSQWSNRDLPVVTGS